MQQRPSLGWLLVFFAAICGTVKCRLWPLDGSVAVPSGPTRHFHRQTALRRMESSNPTDEATLKEVKWDKETDDPLTMLMRSSAQLQGTNRQSLHHPPIPHSAADGDASTDQDAHQSPSYIKLRKRHCWDVSDVCCMWNVC